MHNYLCMLLFTFTDNCFLQWVMCPDESYTCTINLQLTDSFHGMHDVHKQQDRCTTFGWNLMGETSGWLEGFSGNLWIRISECTTEFLVSICKVATFWEVTCCRNNVVSGKWVFFMKYHLECGQRQFTQKFPHYISN